MILTNDLKANGIFKTRIMLAEAFPEDEYEEQRIELDGVYIDIREMSMAEQGQLGSDGAENMRTLAKLLDTCIVATNAETVEGKMASPKQIADFIRMSGTMANHVITKWSESLPLVRRNARKSESAVMPESGANT